VPAVTDILCGIIKTNTECRITAADVKFINHAAATFLAGTCASKIGFKRNLILTILSYTEASHNPCTYVEFHSVSSKSLGTFYLTFTKPAYLYGIILPVGKPRSTVKHTKINHCNENDIRLPYSWYQSSIAL
jgi:hypothetical protein